MVGPRAWRPGHHGYCRIGGDRASSERLSRVRRLHMLLRSPPVAMTSVDTAIAVSVVWITSSVPLRWRSTEIGDNKVLSDLGVFITGMPHVIVPQA